ncbi:MAG: cellulase family glycosylhydrolase [Kiritimatiellae bacterium]|nr:cellulase family glycosylhydrolase [Kiritimatiellia bacterium]
MNHNFLLISAITLFLASGCATIKEDNSHKSKNPAIPRLNKQFIGFEHGMGIGGWLTNYKRFNVLPDKWKLNLSPGDYEHFETYITRNDVQNIASFGMDHIRLGFDQIVLEEKPYVYRERTFRLIDNFISWCREYKINVVLNLHKAIGNYCDIPEPVSLMDDPELQKRFIALWLEFERRYHDNNSIVFELMNEVRNVNPKLWNSLAERTIQTIRKVNPTRKIVIGSTAWNSCSTLKDLQIFDDENVIYTFHIYEPFEFTHQRGVLQAAPLYYNRKMAYPSDIAPYREFKKFVGNSDSSYPQFDRMDIRFMRTVMQPAFDFAKKHPDKILWCGEFGTIRHCDIKYRENWMNDVILLLNEHGIPYCVWNYLSTPNDGNRFSLVDDDTRRILSPRMLEIIQGNVK